MIDLIKMKQAMAVKVLLLSDMKKIIQMVVLSAETVEEAVTFILK